MTYKLIDSGKEIGGQSFESFFLFFRFQINQQTKELAASQRTIREKDNAIVNLRREKMQAQDKLKQVRLGRKLT